MKYRFLLVVVLFSFLVGCDKLDFLKIKKTTQEKDQQVVVKGTVIAKINNLTVTLEELQKEVDLYNASLDFANLPEEEKKKAKIETREKKLDYLKNVMIRQRVFYQTALDRGLNRRDDIIEILEKDKMAILAAEMQREIIKNIDVPSAEIEDAYKTIKNQLKEPESRKIREVVLKTEDEARQVLIELLQGGDFATIAKNRSIAESAKNGGDLGFIKVGERGEQYMGFDEASFSQTLQQGSLSNVFKANDGYCIVKIEGIKEGKQLAMTEVWDRLKELLLARKRNEELDKFYSQVSRNSKIDVYEGELK